MKKFLSAILMTCLMFVFVGCGSNMKSAIELMGAGDRIHDSFTFANIGVNIRNNSENVYTISGSVDSLESSEVKKEFDIENDVSHVVAIKLTAVGTQVDKESVEIKTNGIRAYDAEHLNGSNYTFIILEAIPGKTVSISVKWNKDDQEKTYIINFDENLTLK